MKSTTRSLLVIASLAAGLVATGFAAEPAPGFVDFGKLTAAEKCEYVEVKLDGPLLKLIAKLAKGQDPAAAELIANLKNVRVNVVGLDDTNRGATTERMTAVRAQLENGGWEKIVTARGKRDEDVAVFVKHRGEEAFEGVVVTVIDGKKNEAVFVNVVGDIKPEQLASLAKHLHIDHLNFGGKSTI